MNDLLVSLLRMLVALGIVIVLILITLPYLLPLLQRLSWTSRGKDSELKLRKIVPVGRSMFLVEFEVRGKLFVVAFTEGAVEVIYADDADTS